MEKKNEPWVPGPEDTLDSLVTVQQKALEEFAELSGLSFEELRKRFPSAIVEENHTEVVEQSTNGSLFVRIAKKILGKNGDSK